MNCNKKQNVPHPVHYQEAAKPQAATVFLQHTTRLKSGSETWEEPSRAKTDAGVVSDFKCEHLVILRQ